MNIIHCIIRQAIQSDLPDILKIETESFASDAFSGNQFIRLMNNKNCSFLVAEDNGKIQGYIILLNRANSRNIRIYSIAVDKEARGKNIGATFLNYAENFAREKGKQIISLEVSENNHIAISFYIKHNFIVTGTIPHYYNDGSNALKMGRTIQT